MPDVSVPWGSGSLMVSMPQNWRLQQVAAPELRPAAADWPDRLALALAKPTAGPALGELLAGVGGGRVVLVVEDLTRDSPLGQVLPVIMKEIHHAGLGEDQVEVFFANGMHPPMTDQQMADKLAGACLGLNRRCNQYDDLSAHQLIGHAEGIDILVDRGVADAALRIIVSAVSPHLQAGFGGGYKMVLPGAAHLTTIRGLHQKGLGRRGRQLVGMDVTANPMRLAIDAAGQMMDDRRGRSFAVQYVLDDDNLPAVIAAGTVLPTHRMMAKQCSVACGIVVPASGDVLIVNAHPRDFDMWQSFKCIANTRWAARANGVIICLTRCKAGLHGMPVPPWPVSPAWTRRIVRWMGPEGLSSMAKRLLPSLAGDATFFVRIATQIIHRNPIYMVSPTLHDAGVKFPGLPVMAGIDDAIAAADAYLGSGPQRVVVFPCGGTTFPVPTGPAIGGN